MFCIMHYLYNWKYHKILYLICYYYFFLNNQRRNLLARSIDKKFTRLDNAKYENNLKYIKMTKEIFKENYTWELLETSATLIIFETRYLEKLNFWIN